jgi:putative transposase
LTVKRNTARISIELVYWPCSPRSRGQTEFVWCEECLSVNHDCANTMFLTDSFGYRTTLNRLGLSGRVEYTDRNLIEKWSHTLKQRIDRFHHSWGGSRRSVRRWISHFLKYYNEQRPHQVLDGRAPAEEVLNWTVPEYLSSIILCFQDLTCISYGDIPSGNPPNRGVREPSHIRIWRRRSGPKYTGDIRG